MAPPHNAVDPATPVAAADVPLPAARTKT
jgi:hypothetical protein